MGTFPARACWPQVILLGRNQESGPQGERSSEKERHFQGTEPDVQATGRQMGCRKGAEQAGPEVQSLFPRQKETRPVEPGTQVILKLSSQWQI